MLTKKQFNARLVESTILIIDGGLATELELRGCDLNHPLWSAKILSENPEHIRKLHLDYFLAGADIAITASYQATTQGLREHLGLPSKDAEEIIKKSVLIAKEARQDACKTGRVGNRKLMIAGSVGPFGAYLTDGSEYRGDYVRSIEDFQAFHRPRMRALLDAGVDLLALETMPNLVEIEAVLILMRDEFSGAIAWLSCTARDIDHLSDGSPWKDVLDVVDRYGDQVIAVGINCVPTKIVTGTLRSIGRHTNLPLLCYPNSGEMWDAASKTWSGVRPDDDLRLQTGANDGPLVNPRDASVLRNYAPGLDWTEAGARLVGGCCRTGPAFIQALKASVEHNQSHGPDDPVPDAVTADDGSSPKTSTHIESS